MQLYVDMDSVLADFYVTACSEPGVIRDPSPAKYHKMWERAIELS